MFVCRWRASGGEMAGRTGRRALRSGFFFLQFFFPFVKQAQLSGSRGQTRWQGCPPAATRPSTDAGGRLRRQRGRGERHSMAQGAGRRRRRRVGQTGSGVKRARRSLGWAGVGGGEGGGAGGRQGRRSDAGRLDATAGAARVERRRRLRACEGRVKQCCVTLGENGPRRERRWWLLAVEEQALKERVRELRCGGAGRRQAGSCG